MSPWQQGSLLFVQPPQQSNSSSFLLFVLNSAPFLFVLCFTATGLYFYSFKLLHVLQWKLPGGYVTPQEKLQKLNSQSCEKVMERLGFFFDILFLVKLKILLETVLTNRFCSDFPAHLQ